jgi:acyl-homoserine lactone acylase PvdQ
MAVLFVLGPAAAPAATPEPYQAGDYGGFRNILPPGENGLATGPDIAAFQLALQCRDQSPDPSTCPPLNYPAHSIDQLDMYGNLVYNTPGITAAQIGDFFKDASFGVPAGHVERTYSPPLRCTPTCDVVIVRDSDHGIPHIYGDTRDATLYGAGYVAAEDRLFFMDVLRHAGRGELSGFAGGANKSMDRDTFTGAPYKEDDPSTPLVNEDELQLQYDMADDVYGAEGTRLQQDVQSYVDGINGYILEARVNPTKMPGEYALIGRTLDDWKVTDPIATASLIGGILGKGGGNEVDSAQVLAEAQKRFGGGAGTGVWGDFRRAEDPEAPTTVRGQSFDYEVPRGINKEAVAMPDAGSVVPWNPETGGGPVIPASASSTRTSKTSSTSPTTTTTTTTTSKGSKSSKKSKTRRKVRLRTRPATGLGAAKAVASLVKFPKTNSNALLVSADKSESGRPVAVMGPQVAYFIPEVLMEMDIHCISTCQGQPDLDAEGATFPGVSLYVLLGRGPDYAWSATSAGQDIIDAFAEELCEPDGSAPTINSTNYLYNDECRPMETITRTNNITPNAADQSPPEQYVLRVQRTVHGIVYRRGTIGGKPVAFARERSSYFHEADSARAFMTMNDPSQIQDATDFQHAMYKMNLTFNWFYADDRDIAYFNSGDNPVRAHGVDPNFPTWGTGRWDWQGFNPALWLADYTPFIEHPQAINQSYITSWNNKQAPGFRAADDNWGYGSVYRSQSLDHNVDAALAGGGKISLPELVDAMEEAGTVDLRGTEDLPYMLDVVGTPSDPALLDAVNTLRAWSNSGAHRRDHNQNGVYEDAAAVQLMDAWWPRALDAVFKPTLGDVLMNMIKGMGMHGIDNEPNNHGQHLGSAYQDGWYGYVQKDLRTILGLPVSGHFSRIYCGRGDLATCRDDLRASLQDALADTAANLYDENHSMAGVQRVSHCPASSSDQWCFDSVAYRALGGISVPPHHWINRPTFQQVVEVQGHRPRP